MWYINATGLPGPLLGAKMAQIRDWTEKYLVGDTGMTVLVIPAREDKFCLLETEEEFKLSFKTEKEAVDWLAANKSKFKECLETFIYEKDETPKLREFKEVTP